MKAQMDETGGSHEMILAVSAMKNPSLPIYGYRGRFAPSPTGPLHAGSLVAALGSWLDARSFGGKWLLRIEDLDTPRCIAGADLHILQQLQSCGLHWDGEVTWQSKQHVRYHNALETLQIRHHLYACSCSRKKIANTLVSLGLPTPRDQEQIYPGTCRPDAIGPMVNLADSIKQEKSPSLKRTSAWRLALPQNCNIEFKDRIYGAQKQHLNQAVGDFVLLRSDGIFTYQLAVVVDDHHQNITHIVRGSDLLDNTPRQIYLQNILEYENPQYLHLPIVTNSAGEKLSKQTQAEGIDVTSKRHALRALEIAARHLGLKNLPSGDGMPISDWLMAATTAWADIRPSAQ